jgi:FKBP-type peptidyl-prolyl cis-trans isomerase SlyD
MEIAENTVASFDYTLTDERGTLLDSSEGRGPLSYLHGAGQLIPGLEAALEGQAAGATLAVTVPPADAYGERDEQLVQDVSREAFRSIEQLEPGMRFQVKDQNGQSRAITVTAVDETTVTVDANHPLAGQPLNFKVDIVEVRPATDTEIASGTVEQSDA